VGDRVFQPGVGDDDAVAAVAAWVDGNVPAAWRDAARR